MYKIKTPGYNNKLIVDGFVDRYFITQYMNYV